MYLSSICNAINELYKAEFFKRLDLYVPYLDSIPSEHIMMLHALETLYLKYLRQSEGLHFLTNLRELGIFERFDVMDVVKLAQHLNKFTWNLVHQMIS